MEDNTVQAGESSTAAMSPGETYSYRLHNYHPFTEAQDLVISGHLYRERYATENGQS